ncbi:MAG: acetyl-CoA carboxylase biotin carboxylase subunit [Planctomycetota bacterium]|nr:acetyl-CoA carboxylase biotin carboxylase subunit [Planctomycetota bacterium]
MTPPFKRLLIANRGEIALRIMRTARELGIETVAVYSDVDRNALHVRRADRAVHIGGALPAESYLRGEHILAVAKDQGCDALHPGYGFLAENADFADACAGTSVTFLGPSPQAIRLMGDKVEARKAADSAGVPLVPGMKEDVQDIATLKQKAAEIGYPVMLKAAAGGGGKGIRIVESEDQLEDADRLARAEALAGFGDDRVYLEKLVSRPRHVEIQIMADQHGSVVHYGERECSVQRRHQKLLEETPCTVLTDELRAEMGEAACRLALEVGYVGAGTVEFLYSEGKFYFLEMNTRLQVEHPITEMCYGVDLVAEQLRIAAGGAVEQPRPSQGHSIEVRINAEDPETFLPSLGTITRLSTPGGPGVRLDAVLYRGLEVTPYYDSMLGKLIVHADDRPRAIARMRRALTEIRLLGVLTSIPACLRVLDDASFQAGDYDTGILDCIDRSVPIEIEELAALAAATARYRGTERIAAHDGAAQPVRPASRWVLIDRMEKLEQRPR